MCGITGIINKKREDCDISLLRQVNSLISHRGPDGEGYFTFKNLGFGHRRLAIIDLYDSGNQPMQSSDRFIITYNGEIYNYLEIKSELENLGVNFSTKSDTEVILKSFEFWGEDCVSRFNGMWSFAIFDKFKETVFASRDRFGIKPFYFINNSQIFAFGSEIKQMLALGSEAKVNRQALSDFLFIGYYNHNEYTMFDEVYQLEPGCNLSFNLSDDSPRIYRYYNLNVSDVLRIANENEIEHKFEDILADSFKLHLRSDVKVASFLSGGLDSSYMASFVSRCFRKSSNDILSAYFGCVENNPHIDESESAKTVADFSMIDLKFVKPSHEEFLNALDTVIKIQEEPFGGPSIFMQYFVLKSISEDGIKVVLDGQGGDEILLGYERYYVAYFNSLSFIEKLKSLFTISRNSKLNIILLVGYLIYFNFLPVRKLVLKNRNSFVKGEIKDLFNIELLKTIAKNSKNVFDIQKFEIASHPLRTLLSIEDKNSMFFSIEARLPYLDYRVVEYALRIPISLKIANGFTKYILRKIGYKKGLLPHNIAFRKNKMGFEAPVRDWLEKKDDNIAKFRKSEFLNNFLDLEKIDFSNDLVYWKILNLYKWHLIFNVKY